MGEGNVFENHREAILVDAVHIYRAERAGIDTDPGMTDQMPQNLGDMSDEALHQARLAEAEVRVAARGVAHLADLRDRIQAGGLDGLVARSEFVLHKRTEGRHVREALKAGLVDLIRGPEAQ